MFLHIYDRSFNNILTTPNQIQFPNISYFFCSDFAKPYLYLWNNETNA